MQYRTRRRDSTIPCDRRSRWNPVVGILLVVLGLVASGGCVSYRPTESGFLSGYDALTPDPFHVHRRVGIQRAETHQVAAADLCAVDSFYVEPVEWRVDPTSRGGKSPERRDWLCHELENQLKEQLGATRPIVDQPGPKTARVRAAITMVELSRPVANTLLTMTLISPFGVGPIFSGGGAVEAEVIAPDGRQIAAISGTSKGGFLDPVGYYTRSNHAKKAMRRCAGELTEAISPAIAGASRPWSFIR